MRVGECQLENLVGHDPFRQLVVESVARFFRRDHETSITQSWRLASGVGIAWIDPSINGRPNLD